MAYDFSKNIVPTNEECRAQLGNAYPAFRAICDHLSAAYDIEPRWGEERSTGNFVCVYEAGGEEICALILYTGSFKLRAHPDERCEVDDSLPMDERIALEAAGCDPYGEVSMLISDSSRLELIWKLLNLK